MWALINIQWLSLWEAKNCPVPMPKQKGPYIQRSSVLLLQRVPHRPREGKRLWINHQGIQEGSQAQWFMMTSTVHEELLSELSELIDARCLNGTWLKGSSVICLLWLLISIVPATYWQGLRSLESHFVSVISFSPHNFRIMTLQVQMKRLGQMRLGEVPSFSQDPTASWQRSAAQNL